MLEKATKFHDRKEFEKAMKCYWDILEIIPDHIPAVMGICMILENTGKFDEIASYFKKNKEEEIAVTFLKLAEGFYESRRHEKAMSCLHIATILDSKNYVGFFNRGLMFDEYYDINKNPDMLTNAADCYDKVLKIRPDYTDASFNKGLSLFKLGKHKTAVACYDNILKDDPDNVQALVEKGINLDSLYKHEKAMRCYDRALDNEPHNASAMYNKAKTLYQLDRIRESADLLDEAAKVDPHLPDYDYLKNMLIERLKSGKN